MRPLKLRMKAFGPFAQEVVLDMEKLGEQGTYLITGNTGSGKAADQMGWICKNGQG